MRGIGTVLETERGYDRAVDHRGEIAYVIERKEMPHVIVGHAELCLT